MVRGPVVSDQYVTRTDANANHKISDGDSFWHRMGDLGYLDEDGFLYLTDRKAFTINVGGVNVYPREAEDALIMHPLVADVAVFGIPQPEYGEEVKGVVELLPGTAVYPGLDSELIEFCRSRISGVKSPRSIDFEVSLPRHPNGKL